MEKNLIIMLVTIVAYMLMMVVIGLVCSKKNVNVGDFYLGGRKALRKNLCKLINCDKNDNIMRAAK